MRTDTMSKKMLIDATHAEETRVVVVDGNKVEEFDFETLNKRQIAGNIYLAKVTRVEPSLQAAFVDYGGNRHGFLAFSEIHPDYYQIPVADRQALLAEERAYAKSLEDDDTEKKPVRRRRTTKAAKSTDSDAVQTRPMSTDGISGMDVVDLGDEDAEQDGMTPVAVVEEAAKTGATTEVGGASVTNIPEQAATPDGGDESHASSETATPEALAGDDVSLAQDAGGADNAPASNQEATVDVSEADVHDEDGHDEDGHDDDGHDDDGHDDEGDDDAIASPADRDETIESVADEDVSEEIRLPRKARPRRYKIQEVVKVRQIMLVQVVKEERGNKGAALTTYLSLAGRYCVLMPNTARGGGISRKITNAPDRKKLKEIANEIDVPEGAGLIIRTAGAKRTKTEIKRDYEYLQRLWEQIRELTLKSIAPAPIYEEGDLIKRSIRDLYSREIDEVLVEGERGYRTAKDFMKMIMPSHAKNVKHYNETMPLFARHRVDSYLSAMFNPTVQLRSGGYIVIGITEALVAIDVNSGRATKEGSIEETATKTNLEAAEEVARQVRLRDLAGLIVIDFIDMEDRRNNAAVEKRFKDKLKTDRARIQIGRISGFGLMEMSRQRLRPGMLESSTQPCPSCHGTGLLRSDDSLGLTILRQLEEEGTRAKSREVLVKVPVSIANFLMNQKREHIAQIESRFGMSVRIEADMHLISPDFTMEKFKTATRAVPEIVAPVISIDTSDMDDEDVIDEAEIVFEAEAETDEGDTTPEVTAPAAEAGDDGAPRKKRRRRRRRRGGSQTSGENGAEGSDADVSSETADAESATDAVAEPDQATSPEAETLAATQDDQTEESGDVAQAAVSETTEEPVKKPRRRTRRKPAVVDADAPAAETVTEGNSAALAGVSEGAAEEPVKKPARKRVRKPKAQPAETVAEVAVVSTEKLASVAEATTLPEAASPEPVDAESVAPVEAAAEPVLAPAGTSSEVFAETVEVVSEAVVAEAQVPPSVDAVVAPIAQVATLDLEPLTEPDVAQAPEPVVDPEPVIAAAAVFSEQSSDDKPKKRGWWSLAK
jgi:ribonuclease E